MDRNTTPTKPVIPSQNSANRSASDWLQMNDNHHVNDLTGQRWDLNIAAAERPDHCDHRKALYHLEISLETVISAKLLIETGVLDEDADKRILSLLGEDLIPIKMRPISQVLPSLEASRNWVFEHIQKLRKDMKTDAYSEVKKSLISRYLDQKMAFGGKASVRILREVAAK